MAKETENWAEFGLWVKQKREAKGWTQEELAKRVGFSDRQTIYRIEAGASTKRSSVIKIAKALGESPNRVIAIAFGLPKSLESATDLAERAAQAARTAEMIENWMAMSPEEQARALAVIKVLRDQRPEALEVLGPSFKIVTTDEKDQDQKHIKKSEKPKSK
jgi:transcriptional regulator with XRE-family HTH domain